MKKIFYSILIFLLILLNFSTVCADDVDNEVNFEDTIEVTASNVSELPKTNSRRYIIYDRISKSMIIGKNEDVKSAMASTTKIMTTIVILEKADLNEKVTVSAKAGGTGGSRLGLKRGDKASVRDLLYGLMLRSGNDAAVALAEHVGGSVKEFAELMGVAPTNVYQEAKKIAMELMKGYISVVPEGTKGFEMYSLFDFCKYKDGEGLTFRLNGDMTDFLLNLTGSFSQPLLHDFLKMRSPYSMAIWHLMQMKMKSKKPGITATMGFDISLAELRKVTGCIDKFKLTGHFKDKVLNKAIREIFDCAGVRITYQDIKVGRTIEGFRFFAEGIAHIDLNRIPLAEQERIQANAEKLKKGEPLQ